VRIEARLGQQRDDQHRRPNTFRLRRRESKPSDGSNSPQKGHLRTQKEIRNRWQKRMIDSSEASDIFKYQRNNLWHKPKRECKSPGQVSGVVLRELRVLGQPLPLRNESAAVVPQAHGRRRAECRELPMDIARERFSEKQRSGFRDSQKTSRQVLHPVAESDAKNVPKETEHRL
jgi:hypothetical protein